MKKSILLLLAFIAQLFEGNAQVNNIHLAPAQNSVNGWSNGRGPNGTPNHTTMRAMYLVPAAEMTAVVSQTALTSFGFNYNNGTTGPQATGNFSVYMMNTTDNTYTLGTSWNTAGFTNVYAGTLAIPTGTNAGSVDVVFSSSFTYSGSGLYVLYEYEGLTFATTPATYACITYSPTQIGATNSTTLAPASSAVTSTTTFRPQFRIGYPNPVTNDIAVDYILVPGYLPANTYTSTAAQALVRNASNVTHTNVAVGYSVSGVNNATTNLVIPSLAPGATTLLTFSSFSVAPPLMASGLNTYYIGVSSDQVNTNNLATATTSFNCARWGAGPTITDWTNGVGFGTGSGRIHSRFNLPVTATLEAAAVAITSLVPNGGNNSWAVLTNSTGSVIATSNTVTILPPMYATYHTYTFNPVPLNAGTDYMIGIALTTGGNGAYYPIASYTAPVIPPNTYYTSSLTGTTVTQLSANLGFLGIQAHLAGGCSMVDVGENVVILNSIQVFPNPLISGKTNIKGLEGVSIIEVYNVLGELVFSEKTDQEQLSVDLQAQVSGTYLIRIKDELNRSKVVKVIH